MNRPCSAVCKIPFCPKRAVCSSGVSVITLQEAAPGGQLSAFAHLSSVNNKKTTPTENAITFKKCREAASGGSMKTPRLVPAGPGGPWGQGGLKGGHEPGRRVD